MLISNAAILDLESRWGVLKTHRSSCLERLCARLHLFGRRPPVTVWTPTQLSLVPMPLERPRLRLVENVRAESEGNLTSFPCDQRNGDEGVAPDHTGIGDQESSFRWRRHPQLRGDRATASLSDSERAARLAAVRGVFAARDGELELAADYFCEAVREPAIDLAEVPGFWRLSRAGMTAAIDAYEAAGRHRDAAAMSARIRTVFRPRLVREPRRIAARAASRKVSSGG
jgi:hypothetical protein